MTVEVRIPVSESRSEALVAELAEAGFVAFTREGDATVAWGPSDIWTTETAVHVASSLARNGVDGRIEIVMWPERNWNALWEASIEPVAAGPFMILPSWADAASDAAGRIPLRLDPKMSFGTGHHASTRLALELLSRHVGADARVLDVGCGTGILAIGALLLGARHAIGCDIDEWSVPNAAECAALNGLSDRFEVRLGDLSTVPEREFDLILANIIRSTLVALLPELASRLGRGARLVLAGLLVGERDEMARAARANALEVIEEAAADGWWACVMARKTRHSSSDL